MQRNIINATVSGVLGIIAIAILPLGVQASDLSIPPLINYQGRLTDAQGQPLDTGSSYRLAFRFYDAPTSGALVWGRAMEVTVVNGHFNVILGDGGAAIDGDPPAAVNNLAFAFGAPDRYLEVTVLKGVDGVAIIDPLPILPRQKILSAPFAITAANGAPVGGVMPYAGPGAVDPPGWLICNGREVSRVQYADLFALIGEIYGPGDGNSTFNIPDYRGLFMRGVDDPQGMGAQTAAGRDPDATARMAPGTGLVIGGVVGSLQNRATALPNTSFITSNDGEHDHTMHAKGTFNLGHNYLSRSNNAFSGGGGASFGSSTNPDTNLRTSADGSHGHVVSSGGDAETRPDNVYVNYLIKY